MEDAIMEMLAKDQARFGELAAEVGRLKDIPLRFDTLPQAAAAMLKASPALHELGFICHRLATISAIMSAEIVRMTTEPA